MALTEKIDADLKEAMKARDENLVWTLRMLKSAIAYALIDKKELSQGDILDVISKQVKQRQDSISGFEKGNRPDLAAKEKKELQILLTYLPKQLSQQEIEVEVAKAIQEAGAHLGQVMKILMNRLKGRADSKLISQIVNEKLSA